jgi:hypothetical protein
MKRILYTLALLALVACSDDEVINQSSSASNEMRFSATTDNSALVTSRRVHENSTDDKYRLRCFNLYAEKTGTDDIYFDDETLDRDNTSTNDFSFLDGYTRYWPADGKNLDFYALHIEHNCVDYVYSAVINDDPEFKKDTSGEMGITVTNLSNYTDIQRDDSSFKCPNLELWCALYIYFYTENGEKVWLEPFLEYENMTEEEFKRIYQTDYLAKDAAKFLSENLDDYQNVIKQYYISNGSTQSFTMPVLFQEDILYNAQKNVSKPDDGVLNLQFHHAMSKVALKMTVESPNLVVEIPYGGIQLVGFKNKATFSFGHVSDDVATKGNVVSSGDVTGNYDNCKWVMDDDAKEEYCTYDVILDGASDLDQVPGKIEGKEVDVSQLVYILMNNEQEMLDKRTMVKTLYSLEHSPILLIPQHVSEGKFVDGKPTGLFLKVPCYIAYIGDLTGFNKYLSEYYSLKRSSYAMDAARKYYTWAWTDTDYSRLSYYMFKPLLYGIPISFDKTTTVRYGPYGMMLFGNTRTFTSSTTYKNTATYKDLYIPLPEITWKPGKSYVYNITFDTESGASTQVYDEDGNPVLMNISVDVTSVDQWGNGGTSEVEITQ